MTDIKIPAAVVEAAARAMWPQWDTSDIWGFQVTKNKARAAIAAALSAWPGGETVDKVEGDDVALLLPLPQEKGDE